MFRIELADKSDSDKLKQTMLESFSNASIKDFGVDGILPPGVKDGEQVDRAFEKQHIYSMWFSDELIGGIICEIKDRKENYLQTFWILPDHQDKKFGSKALEFLENTYPDITTWVLETPKQSKRNQYFYEKHGYVKVREESFENSPVVLFHYRKNMK